MLERFGVSMEEELLGRFDRLCDERGYTSRSEALRDLVRRELVAEEWNEAGAEVIGAITLVYNHHSHDLTHLLTEVQHQHYDAIICTTHIHMDEENCLEVVIVRGASGRVRQIADQLISARSVKHGQLVCSTTGNALP